MIIHASFADFILFVYVHMSEADRQYDPAEMKVIQKKMAGLFPRDTDFEKKLYATIREYNSFDKSSLNKLFEDSLSYFINDEFKQRHKVYADLQDIILADGKVDASETKVLNTLRDIIDLNIEKKSG